jgi:hypothetical protein
VCFKNIFQSEDITLKDHNFHIIYQMIPKPIKVPKDDLHLGHEPNVNNNIIVLSSIPCSLLGMFILVKGE